MAAPDGNLWFAEHQANHVGRITLETNAGRGEHIAKCRSLKRSRLRAYGAAVFIALLAACSGSVNTIPAASIGTPPPSPTPTPPPPGILSVNPTAMQLLGTGSRNAASGLVQETGYSGTFSESDTCTGIATVVPSSGTGPTLTFTVTGVAAGNCSATFSDTLGRYVSTAITVTIVSGSVQ